MKRMSMTIQDTWPFVIAIMMGACSAGTKAVSDEMQPEMTLGQSDLGMRLLDVSHQNDQTHAADSGQAASVCDSGYQAPQSVPIAGYPDLVEASGLAASRRIEHRYWIHNDSGHEPIVYSVDQQGRLMGRLTIPVNAIDWEDMAVARCPGRDDSCLWIADIGDNLSQRSEVSMVITPEPDGPGDRVADEVWTLRVLYEDGPTDAEAVFVASDGSRFWIIEKAGGRRIKLYESQGTIRNGGQVVMRSILEFDAPGIAIERGRLVTAADLHPTGTRVLVRVYTGTYEYRLTEPERVSDIAGQAPVTVALGPLSEGQGEAVAYSADGRHALTISEDPEGQTPQPLNIYRCTDP
ncbi:MAG: hypothetical protein CMH52_04580 [Myxococcales bacterium]|nr:hypothetical protein [Myxococcales bacterium]|tara:strand:+ start:913 stop:1962 length:1050 start_codon:yes stop_codon:yes gene_type:complete